MCTRPICVRNRKIDKSIKSDKEFIFVPCGHCVECRQKYTRDYEIRSYFEWIRTLDNGGVTYFYTLTYNNQNLPHADVFSHYELVEKASLRCPIIYAKKDSVLFSKLSVYKMPVFKSIPCFDKISVQLFLRALDARLNRNYGIGLRYFLTSEYGGKTHRPHYHVLFFLDKPIPPKEFRSLVSLTWVYGFNAPGKNFGRVNSVDACRYVAKYVAKDVAFDKEISSIHDEADYNNCRQFHLQSQGFGVYAFNLMSPIQQLKGLCSVPNQKRSGFVDVVLPLYLLRKRYYDTVKNSHDTNSYILNAAGKSRCFAILDERIKSQQTALDELLNCSISDPLFIQRMDFLCKEKFSVSYKDFPCLVDTLLSSHQQRDFILFRTLLCGHRYTFDFDESSTPKDVLSYFLEDSPDFLFDDNLPLYDDDPKFLGFSQLSVLVDEVQCYHNFQRYRDGVLHYNAIQKQRFDKGVYSDLQLLDVPNYFDYLNL